MNWKRRYFLRGSGLLGAGWLLGRTAAAQHQHGSQPPQAPPKQDKPEARGGIVPVHTPDVEKLQWTMDGGVKVFHLTAEVVKREFLPASHMGPARVIDAWGYNGSVPGPTIEVNEGDRVRIVFHNRLPEPTSIHWHGLEVPPHMDGVPFISQPPVEPGGMFTYEFTLHQNGTFFYHSHGAMQEMMGMIGLFIIHPKTPYQPRVDKDFGLILQEWAILPNNTIPNSLAMEFNWLTINGKAGPATTPLIVRQGERVRIRLVNLGMDHHPMHLHGNQFYVTGTEGGRIPESAWYPGNTVLVGVAQARDIEFDAIYPGDWMLHCHLPHHMMNQMVSMVGPMARAGHGLQTGRGMEEGMGMVRQGHALSDELGPGLGRGMGITSEEQRVSNIASLQRLQPASQHQGHGTQGLSEAERKRVPGYPQDMIMIMDEAVAKPETYGLAPGWTASMMGMMTLVRVLPPDKYEEVMTRIREGRTEKPQPAGHQHHED
jgi:FtsP/CotA-like multicopper oxidase with cupredoxin domain